MQANKHISTRLKKEGKTIQTTQGIYTANTSLGRDVVSYITEKTMGILGAGLTIACAPAGMGTQVLSFPADTEVQSSILLLKASSLIALYILYPSLNVNSFTSSDNINIPFPLAVTININHPALLITRKNTFAHTSYSLYCPIFLFSFSIQLHGKVILYCLLISKIHLRKRRNLVK